VAEIAVVIVEAVTVAEIVAVTVEAVTVVAVTVVAEDKHSMTSSY
jgi:hypothetical protein